MASESALADRRTAFDGSAAVHCDQAIFSSVRTPVGQGYQVVAASGGLTANEKRDITTRSPSHGGLCEDGQDATGMAFYKLSSGRVCLACSRDAGAEHTGRGVRRIYTHITVLTVEDFARFAFSPFSLVLAIEQTGALEVQLTPPRVLELLKVRTPEEVENGPVSGVLGAFGTGWIAYALSVVLGGRRLVIGGNSDPFEWVAAVMLGVPGPLRADVSFSAGLRFSVGRQYAMTVVNGNLNPTRRLVRGQRLEYLEPKAGAAAPRHADSPWLQMVTRRYERSGGAGVAAIASRAIPDCSPEGLDRIGAIGCAMDAVKTAEERELLAMADDVLIADPVNDFEAGLTRELLAEAQSRLCRRLRTDGRIDSCWSELLSLLGRNRPSADFALSLVGVALEWLGSRAPIRAAAYGLEAARAATDAVIAQRLEPHLAAVLQNLQGWVSVASLDDVKRVRGVLSEWCIRVPRLAAVGTVLAQIESRLGGPSPVTGTSHGSDAFRA